MTRSTLSQTFNHIAFPPKLPGSSDSQSEAVEKDLVLRLLNAVQTIKSTSDEQLVPAWQTIENSLKTCSLVNQSEAGNKTALLDAFTALSPENAIILYVREQNAGFLMYQRHDEQDQVIFEAFECSPAAELTLASQSSLQWDFPGTAAALSCKEFGNPHFQDTLATFLEKAVIEPLEDFAPKTKKAGAQIVETRDTVNPALITQFLMTLIETNGKRVYPSLLRKRVKDDVCWDNSELPWRRSPLWLVLRVSIQRLLYLRLGSTLGRFHYKYLMTILLSHLLDDCARSLDSEQRNFLKAKLCRRLAKLEGEKNASTSEIQEICNRVVRSNENLWNLSIQNATSMIGNEWTSWKREFRRKIPPLPFQAHPNDLYLTLPHSGAYLKEILNANQHSRARERDVSPKLLANVAGKNTTKQFASLAKQYSSLAYQEKAIESETRTIPTKKEACEALCLDTAHRIEDYMIAVGDAYDNDPGQMSHFILNIFDLWVYMDRCMATAYPLLQNYHPWFHPELLDVLLLPRMTDLKRLQDIQSYLNDRCAGSYKKKMTIFSDPVSGCFSDVYFETDGSGTLKGLEERISALSQRSREEKEAELNRVNQNLNDLNEKLRLSSCTQRRNLDGTHDIKGCSHCFYLRSRRRLKIEVHEAFLPERKNKISERRAVIFELGMPQSLAVYRKVTWNVINRLCPKVYPSAKSKPEKLLLEYSKLAKHNKNRVNSGLSLASQTKSFLGTHYNWRRLPARAESVLLPHGLTYSFYDKEREIWASEYPEQLSLAHHFVIHVPKERSLSGLYSSSLFAADGPGPSSYEAIASVSECPAELTVHEFTSHQILMGGRNRRWLSILSELGSSNMNLSLHETMVLLHHLSLQAGPMLNNDALRTVHVIFRDRKFCTRLIEQINRHIETIASNWRETTYMESLLTLTIRLCSLCLPDMQPESYKILWKIRRVTLEWITVLRDETRNAQEVDVSERAARFCFLSALLCRRTFAVGMDELTHLDNDSLQTFFVASLAMQESLVVDLSKFSQATRNMLVRDIKMTAIMAPMLHTSIKLHPHSMSYAINTAWPGADNNARMYTGWKLVPHPYQDWVTSTIQATENTLPQVIYFHLYEGHLVIDGQTIGKLPADIRDSEILKEVFGNQRLFAFPSNLPGMDYALTNRGGDYEIHLGYRNEELVIRARTPNSTLELVPRHVFGSGPDFDLPRPLVYNCIHWLDLQFGVLEVRQKPHIWIRKLSNWKINVRTRKGQRKGGILVDPFSRLAKTMAQIFVHFEHPSKLTIFQHNKLSVELRDMDLSFFVNKWEQLECRELGAVVDRNQDVGTLYGLQSMLVLHDVFDRSQRSIIAPIGRIHCRRCKAHVHVQIENEGGYVRYIVDDILGRLESPAEPLLLYLKAQLHAFTSHFLPDPLTGRTGTEEALSCLQSGYCQPCVPLSPAQLDRLLSISSLTPKREYYPKNMRCQQIVSWDPQLTTTIQHDAFQPVVNDILRKSQKLSLFQADGTYSGPECTETITHLHERAHWRRSTYERSGILSEELRQPEDISYVSRDGFSIAKRVKHVREIVNLLHRKPTTIHTTSNLKSVLEKWPYIGGYENKFSLYSLDGCLNANIANEWGALVNLCKAARPDEAYHLMFQLGMVAFRDSVDMTPLRAIIAFFLLDGLRELDCPHYPSFMDFRGNEEPRIESFIPLVRSCCEPLKEINIIKVKKQKKLRTFSEQSYLEYEDTCASESRGFVTMLIQQWPCSQLSVDEFQATYLNVAKALEAVTVEWSRLYQNLQLNNHIKDVQIILNKHTATKNDAEEPFTGVRKETMGPRDILKYIPPTLGQDLLKKPASHLDRVRKITADFKFPLYRDNNLAKPLATQTRESAMSVEFSTPEITELEGIVGMLAQSDCSVSLRYARDLGQSITALKEKSKAPELKIRTNLGVLKEKAEYLKSIAAARADLGDHHQVILDLLSQGDSRFKWLQNGNLWPCMTPLAILQQLRSNSRREFGRGMKELFISFGLAIVKLQKLCRLKDAFFKKNKGKFLQEYANPGHVNWDPLLYPDWLLLEIDSNIQIRPEQVTVALEMISPASGSNSVLQMNMGQGKTSVIMPMVAAILADGLMLNRLLVPKALLSQTAQVLQSRLGGILGREITHVPFSRRTRTSVSLIQEYRGLHNSTIKASGIMLCIPEHVLSFKLSGLQRLSDSKISEAVEMVKTQNWMDQVCRDVLDECDFTLAVKTQLIYPGGSQLSIDGHPNRWEVAMTVLDLAARHLYDLAHDFPQSIDVLERGDSSFPVVHLLRKDVEQALTSRIVDDITNGRTSILPIRDYTDGEKEAIRNFISQEKIPHSVSQCVSNLFTNWPKALKNMYLLRGLLVHGILILCLKKRWNVQYGLHHGRDPMAVPFHAKGVPSEQAEWGHPDVAILFTCLAFYYEGLSQSQLKQSLEVVLKSDHPATEYDRWTHGSNTLPESLRHWNIIAVDDEGQIGEIWRHLRSAMVVINHFLCNFVFPIHAKQFATKLQASGWDVLSYHEPSNHSDDKISAPFALTTGFSGTNDNRRLLPLTIEQCDLPSLAHTNAEVLTYLLQPRNRQYQLAAGPGGRRLSEVDLLEHLKTSEIRILIDTGAFIMEMNNLDVVKTWLQADPRARGAVYFGRDNRAWFHYRNGKRVPLVATPFADNLNDCLIYLDEAHTRGTDLKLPADARGALTLGLGQTKDQTVQAAMRLRQLGTTQSVAFISPPEVHQSILDVSKKVAGDNLDSSDVVKWLLYQTCANNLDLQPLYFAQGKDFCHRKQAAATYNQFLSNSTHRNAYLEALRQPEQQTLEQLYAPQNEKGVLSSPASDTLPFDGRVALLMQNLTQRRQHSQVSQSITSSALEEVEQEREVAYEIEEERELQRPRRPKALTFPGLHDSILHFTQHGVLDGDGYTKASTMLEGTELGGKYKIDGSFFASHLYVSLEYIRTIKLKRGEKNDSYTRPVNWLVLNIETEVALIIIPEEAEALIPCMRNYAAPNVHLITYAAPFTKTMLHFNNLDYYALPSLPNSWSPPSWIRFELGVVAGRLYFEFSEYANILNQIHSLPGNSSGRDDSASNSYTNQSIIKRHICFLQEWLSVRRQGQDISHTPMGYVCQGWPLRSDHPFFTSRVIKTPNSGNGNGLQSLRYESQEVEDEEYEEYEEYDSDDMDAVDMLEEKYDGFGQEDMDH